MTPREIELMARWFKSRRAINFSGPSDATLLTNMAREVSFMVTSEDLVNVLEVARGLS